MVNLDYVAGQYAKRLLSITDGQQKNNKENLLNKALGILAEQGPFALMLWAQGNRSGNQGSRKIGDVILDAFRTLVERELGLKGALSGQDPLQSFNDRVCQDFGTLMMVRQLFDRTLIYARHYAKTEG